MIRRFLHSLLALAFLTVHANAGFLVDPFIFASAAPPASGLVDCTADAANVGPTFTFTSHATGTAHASRHTVVGIGSEDATTNFTISSATIGGSAAVERADSGPATPLSSVLNGFYALDNPTGTTATITVTLSEAATSMYICVWALYDLASITPTGNRIASDDTYSGALTLTTTSGANGAGDIILGMCAEGVITFPPVWTGLTVQTDENSGTEARNTSAHSLNASAGLSITCDWTGAGATDDVSGATVAYNPN